MKHIIVIPVFNDWKSLNKLLLQLNKNLEKLNSWQNLNNLIPKYYKNNKMFKTGSAGLLAACLELTKEGILSIEQKKMFDEILIKKSN